MKICLVGSSGGHLSHLMMLEDWWRAHERFWVTFDKEDARSKLVGERVYSCYFPTNRNLKNLVRNTFLAWKVLKREKPDLIVSSGAAVAVPFFYLGKLLGAKTIYLEVFDRMDAATLTGKLVYPVADRVVVQWDEMTSVYPKAVNLGSIF
ncbi:UDP-N-acetylglucosamine--LPS N-acetylglucosamine transferase [Bombiscardovia nodaiensis]|uniref:UDP-N-acetylglucosamine--LPS N-acetylglucosamine transferase n=1 Tax=Bombiscardovia nodaiensis TaxID=2932181 RepID=A0ABM8B934_9BIFI|nr:UDP-N-acetylglucosamine--LPS N-acetylglucosamine transferase [Bombiscardovia nodaiensis]